jgi:TPP-dependent indolepyruvate ferredoxin oxidoreductase alpha subunit
VDKRTNKSRRSARRSRKALTLEELQPLVERQLKQIVNKQKLYTLLSVMQVDGQIVSRAR